MKNILTIILLFVCYQAHSQQKDTIFLVKNNETIVVDKIAISSTGKVCYSIGDHSVFLSKSEVMEYTTHTINSTATNSLNELKETTSINTENIKNIKVDLTNFYLDQKSSHRFYAASILSSLAIAIIQPVPVITIGVGLFSFGTAAVSLYKYVDSYKYLNQNTY